MTARRAHPRCIALSFALLLAASSAHAQWHSNGGPVCISAGDQVNPVIIPDGAGGSLIAWEDSRNGATTGVDAFIQRLTVNGARATGWPLNGLALSVAAGDQTNLHLVSDGAGGAIAVWEDRRSGNPEIYAQRVTAAGVPSWTLNGVKVANASGAKSKPSPVADGSGGVIVLWDDDRDAPGTRVAVYAQRLDATGNVVAGWPVAGLRVCTTASNQSDPVAVSDDAGGAIVAWSDDRGDATFLNKGDIYASRVTAAGALAAAWTASGSALCTSGGLQFRTAIARDAAGGAYVCWEDRRTGQADLFVERVASNGSIAVGWPGDGISFCYASGEQGYIQAVPDGAGGLLATWWDNRLGEISPWDIYAIRMNPTATVTFGWPTNGQPATTAFGLQSYPTIAADGSNGALIAWNDERNGTDVDIYAGHLTSSGALAPGWTANGVALCTAPNDQLGAQIINDGVGGAVVAWQDKRSGTDFDIYATRVLLGGGVLATDSNGPPVEFALHGLEPNPAVADLAVAFTLPSAEPASLELLDIAGRRLDSAAVGALGPGRHRVKLADASSLSPGIYFVRLSQAGRALSARACVVR